MQTSLKPVENYFLPSSNNGMSSLSYHLRMFMRIRPMESNLLNSASDFLYDTHFYFNILSLAAIISARWLQCHKHGKCFSIASCSPLILIGAHFLSLEINQLHDLSLFKNMMKKRPCSEINAFKNSDPVHGHRGTFKVDL
jgi:hypothetical protein